LTPAGAREFQRFLLAKHKDVLAVLDDAQRSDADLKSQAEALGANYVAHGDDDWFEGDDNIDRGPAPVEAGPGPSVHPGSGIPPQLVSNRGSGDAAGGHVFAADFTTPPMPPEPPDPQHLPESTLDGIHGTGGHSMPILKPPGELGPYGYEEAVPGSGVWIWGQDFSHQLVIIPPDSNALAPSNYELIRTAPDGTMYWWPRSDGPG
jgi:hypothetical protein